MSKPEQYVGISGGVKAEQQAAVLTFAETAGIRDFGAFVMWGVQASTKTQIQEIPTKYGESWHPVGANIKDAGFVDATGLTRPSIHVYGGDHDLAQQMVTISKVVERTTEFHQGLQFNRLEWQNPEYDEFMEWVREQAPNIPIVLQCHDRILAELSPNDVINRLRKLKPEYVLFDVSHGKGVQMDPDFVYPYIDAIYQAHLEVGVVVGGGVSAATMDATIAPLYEDFPDLSCDAEGAMRKGEEGQTILDLDKVNDYLHAWTYMMQDIVGPRSGASNR